MMPLLNKRNLWALNSEHSVLGAEFVENFTKKALINKNFSFLKSVHRLLRYPAIRFEGSR